MKSDEHSELDGLWRVVEIAGERLDPEAVGEVRLEDGRVSGRVGVNRFNGSYTVVGDTIELGPAALTRMAGPPEMMDLENRFHRALEGKHKTRIETRLVLDDLVLVLEPDPEANEDPAG